MKKHRVIPALLCFCLALSSYGQDEQLLHKTYAQRAKPLLAFYEDSLRFLDDSLYLFNRINHIKKLAIENNDGELLMEAILMRVHYFHYRRKFPATLVLSMIASLQRDAVKKNKSWLVARTEGMKAYYNFYVINQYELAFEHFHKLYDMLMKFTSEEYPLKQTWLYQMAFAYYQFAEFRKTIFYSQEALLEKPAFEGYRYLSMNIPNTIGLCYQHLDLLDSSDYYFKLSYQKASAENVSVWQGISSGNLGYNYFLRKQYDKAIPLFKKYIETAIESKYWALASGSLMPLAAINLERNNIRKAEELLQQAKHYIYRSNMDEEYKRLQTLYPLLSKLYAAKGNAALAAMFLDSAIYVKDSIARQFNAMQILRAQQKLEREKQKAEVELITSQKKIQLLQRNILIAGIALLMLVAIYVYRRLQKKQLLNKEKLQRSEAELSLATKQLGEFTKYISEKNNFIETLQRQLDNGEKMPYNNCTTQPFSPMRNGNIFASFLKKCMPVTWKG